MVATTLCEVADAGVSSDGSERSYSSDGVDVARVATDGGVVEDYDDTAVIEPGTVTQLLGYKQSFYLQGFWQVSDDRPARKVVREFDI